MKKLTFLTCAQMQDFVSDDQLCSSHFKTRGYDLIERDWRNLQASDFETSAMILRTTWDYLHHAEEFLTTLKAISAAGVPLFNSLAMVEWNLRKTYLAELQDRGVRLPPTFFLRLEHPKALEELMAAQPEVEQWILKPQVSLNAHKTFWLKSEKDVSAAAQQLQGTNVIFQAFLPEVLDSGEISLFYFNGSLSHAVRKRPAQGDFRVQEEHGGQIRLHIPSQVEMQEAEKILSFLPELPLYARVDLIPTKHGPVLMELELIEPALYLRFDPEAPARFADAVVSRLEENSSR